MNIDWIIPCRYVEVHDNLGTIVGAGIDTLWVQQLPSPVQVVLAVRLLAVADELGEGVMHQTKNRVRDPSGEPLSEVGGDFAVESDSPQTEWLNGIMLATVVQFEATVEGTYMIEHEVDTASASVPIHIVHGAPPGAP